VLDRRDQTADTRAIRAFNRKLRRDRRVEISLVPIGDGLTLAVKR
jgi:predicted O-methyltransferase YrrM